MVPPATLAPGEVEIARYGQPEDVGAYRNAGFWAVRFDPPFEPPYTITKIRFPSFTMNGVPAVFPSVRLCPPDPTKRGFPNVNAPVFQVGPYSGSADGMNEIPVDLAVPDSGRIFYVCVEFPSSAVAGFPNNYPFLRMDYRDLDHGYFATSFAATATGLPAPSSPDRNLIVSLVCQLRSPDAVPIEASSNLGANRLDARLDFGFVPAGDERADGTPMPPHSLLRTDLLYTQQNEPWRVWGSAGPGRAIIPVDSFPRVGGISWATQSVDRAGHRGILSSVVLTTDYNTINTPGWDADEPNGSLNEAKRVALPLDLRDETLFPAGDQDFFAFEAAPGSRIETSALADFTLSNAPDLVLFLYDNRGRVVAFDENPNGSPNPRIEYSVPPPSPSSRSSAARRFTLQVADIRGSTASPSTAPRVLVPGGYRLSLNVTPGSSEGARLLRTAGAQEFGFVSAHPNPANPACRFAYVVPSRAGGTRVQLRIYDVTGRLVRSLVDRDESPGPHLVVWDGSDDAGRHVASGTYYLRMEAGSFHHEEKVLIVK